MNPNKNLEMPAIFVTILPCNLHATLNGNPFHTEKSIVFNFLHQSWAPFSEASPKWVQEMKRTIDCK